MYTALFLRIRLSCIDNAVTAVTSLLHVEHYCCPCKLCRKCLNVFPCDNL
jgi:hypothetical protein